MAAPALATAVKTAAKTTAAQRAANSGGGGGGRRGPGLLGMVVLLLAAPVITVGLLVSLIAGVAQPPTGSCPTAGAADTPAGGGPLAAGLFAAPLILAPGRSYEVGATRYGGSGDPTSTSYGAIPDPAQDYLPDHPDTFAELSLLDSNPANTPRAGFTFADADALNNLPYMTALDVFNDGQEAVLYKRDVGYGQGPGQTIPDGQPYRLDVWWQSAAALGISKTPVTIALAPATGAAATLGQTPAAQSAPAAATVSVGVCAPAGAGAGIPLPLTPGTQTQILPSGLAAAGQDAPAAVQAMVAAGNRLFGLPYIYGGAHGSSLDTLQLGYDCSSAVSYVLHAGGVLGPNALVSGELETWGLPGPGRYVTVYTNAGHVFMYVAGLRFDTVYDAAYDTGPNSGKSGPRWRVYDGVPDWASWVVRHPPGL